MYKLIQCRASINIINTKDNLSKCHVFGGRDKSGPLSACLGGSKGEASRLERVCGVFYDRRTSEEG